MLQRKLRVWRGRGEQRAPTGFTQHRGCSQLRGEMPQFQLREEQGGKWEIPANTCFYWGEKKRLKFSPATDLRDSCKLVLNSTFIPIETLQQVQEEVRKDFKELLHFRKLS